MGLICVDGDTLTVQGAPPYTFKDGLTPGFLECLLAAEPGEEGFIGELAKSFTPQQKLDILLTVKSLGGAILDEFMGAAGKWAAVNNDDNQWHLEDFRFIYEAELNTSWAYNVLISTANIRFVRTPRGVLTFPEFQYIYGINLVDHIDDHIERLKHNLADVKRHITSELLLQRMSVIDPLGNVVTSSFPVLESIPPKEWVLPEGYTFLHLEED